MHANLRYYPLLFEMLRSFTTLADTLNLSHAVRELGSTRQTVRRHVSQLEEIKGGPLFVVNDRQYQLTDLGCRVLPEAQHLLSQAEGWLFGNASMIGGMQYLRHSSPDGWYFFQQQHPIGRVFSSPGTMLHQVMMAWTDAGGQLEHEAMRAVRPCFTVFRKVDDNWLFTEVGEESSYVSWFGWAVARSSIGRVMGQMPGGSSFGRLVNMAYDEVETNQSVRLDHVLSVLPKGDDGDLVPICYERLLLGSRFPDGSFAMISVVRRTYDVEIKGVTHEMLEKMPKELLM